MKAARSPRERPHRTPGPRGRVSQQRRRSPEPDCPHRSSPPGTRETASSARDRPPQRSASSDPSANRGGIIQRESNNSVRFHTTRTRSGHERAAFAALHGLDLLYSHDPWVWGQRDDAARVHYTAQRRRGDLTARGAFWLPKSRSWRSVLLFNKSTAHAPRVKS